MQKPIRTRASTPRWRLRLEELERRDTPTFLALPPFDPGSTFAKVVAAGDFNGDGRSDLAVAHEAGGSQGGMFVSILLSNGDGSFTTADLFEDTAMSVPRDLAAIDLNGDGQLDLVVASASGPNGLSTGSLLVYTGNGNGTFTGPTFIDTNPTFAVGVADFTGDAIPDLVALQFTLAGDEYRVFTGTGNATFISGVAQPTALNVNRIVTADFDGDGNQDFAGLDSAIGSIITYYGTGTGDFGAPVNTALSFTPDDLVAGDFDDDGLIDVAVAGSAFTTVVVNTLTLHSNLGGQTGFDNVGVDILPSGSFSQIVRLASADVDRNGLPDIIAHGIGQAYVATSAGGGDFTPDPGNPYITPVTFGAGDIAAGDFDGDGNIDFATVGQDSLGGGNSGDVFLNLAPDDTQTTLTSEPNPSQQELGFTLTATVSPLVPPLPASGPPQGSVRFTTGETILGSAPVLSGVAILPVSGLTAGTYPIVATYLPAGAPVVFLTSSSSPLTQVVEPPPPENYQYEVTGGPLAPGTSPSRIASGRFYAGDFPDIVVGTGPGQPARVQIVDGTNRNVVVELMPFGISFTGGVFVAAGDIDGDGRADLAVTADVGGGPRVQVYLNRAGTLELAADFMALDPDFRGGLRVALGDVNNDGFADLVVTPGPGGGPRVAAFDGATLRSGVEPVRLRNDFFAYDPNSRIGLYIAVGDLNGDGFGELIVGADAGGGPRVTVFDGASFTSGALTITANFFSGPPDQRSGIRVAARDLNGDGSVELITGTGIGAGSIVRLYSGPIVVSGIEPTPFVEIDAFPGFNIGIFVA